jgi:hypothetical protein
MQRLWQRATTPICQNLKETTMNAETFLLKTFFAAAVLACVLTMGAMVTTGAPHVGATATTIAAAR